MGGFARSFAVPVVGAALAGCSAAPDPAPGPTAPPSPAVAVTTTQTVTPTPATPTPTARGWKEIFDDTEGGVLRVSTLSCDEGGGMGSGFLAGDGLVVTAAHVVSGARTVTVQDPDGSVAVADVVGLDESTDTAVLRPQEPIGDTDLTLAEAVPSKGSDLAVLGYPLATFDLRITTGIVTGLPEAVDYEDQRVDRAFITDAAINPGNSGGPVLDEDGEVVGLASGVLRGGPVEGVGYVVPVDDVASTLRQFAAADPVESTCAEDVELPTAPEDLSVSDWDGELRLTTTDPGDAAAAVGLLLFTHGASINEGSYSAAFEMFTPEQQQRLGGLDEWSRGVERSWWADIDVLDVQDAGGGDATATVALRTFDLLDDGTRCTLWRLDYELTTVDDGWLIDRATGSKDSCE